MSEHEHDDTEWPEPRPEPEVEPAEPWAKGEPAQGEEEEE